MRESCRNHDIIWKIAPGGHAFPSNVTPPRAELTPELQKYLHILGPTPKRCLETFADLGMSDAEIARYFKMPCELVTELRELWNINCAA